MGQCGPPCGIDVSWGMYVVGWCRGLAQLDRIRPQGGKSAHGVFVCGDDGQMENVRWRRDMPAPPVGLYLSASGDRFKRLFDVDPQAHSSRAQ